MEKSLVYQKIAENIDMTTLSDIRHSFVENLVYFKYILNKNLQYSINARLEANKS